MSEPSAELRRRLLEAEETLRAIREGEVDALVVGAIDREQVLSIGGDPEAFRSFIEGMEAGAAVVDDSGRILYSNGAFARLTLRASAQPGDTLADLFDPETARTLADCVESNREGLQDLRIPSGPRGAQKFLQLSVRPLQLGLDRGTAITLTDVTERIQAEREEQAERSARAIIASANEAVLVCDLRGIVTHANAAARAVYAGDPVGLSLAQIVPMTFVDATGLTGTADLLEFAAAGDAIQGIEATAQNAPAAKDFLVSAAPLRGAGDEVNGSVVTMVDLSQRKAAERRQALLMRELDHRVKNTLTLVLAISRRTLLKEQSFDDFQTAFTARIQALAATHNLLAERSWEDLSVRDIIDAELMPFVDIKRPRIEIDGLETRVQPRAAIALGLVVHELATNAVKYGALAREGGHIRISSAIPRTQPDDPLRIEWREHADRLVTPPLRFGYGQTVISRSLEYASGGGAVLRFEPEGVVCDLAVPAVDVVDATV
jgi:PAS domain S-box-containing protein